MHATGPDASFQALEPSAGSTDSAAYGAPLLEAELREAALRARGRAVLDCHGIAAVGSRTAFVEPGSPWENGYIENFNAAA